MRYFTASNTPCTTSPTTLTTAATRAATVCCTLVGNRIHNRNSNPRQHKHSTTTHAVIVAAAKPASCLPPPGPIRIPSTNISTQIGSAAAHSTSPSHHRRFATALVFASVLTPAP